MEKWTDAEVDPIPDHVTNLHTDIKGRDKKLHITNTVGLLVPALDTCFWHNTPYLIAQ